MSKITLSEYTRCLSLLSLYQFCVHVAVSEWFSQVMSHWKLCKSILYFSLLCHLLSLILIATTMFCFHPRSSPSSLPCSLLSMGDMNELREDVLNRCFFVIVSGESSEVSTPLAKVNLKGLWSGDSWDKMICLYKWHISPETISVGHNVFKPMGRQKGII